MLKKLALSLLYYQNSIFFERYFLFLIRWGFTWIAIPFKIIDKGRWMSVQTQNTLLGIFLLVLFVIEPNGMAQNAHSDDLNLSRIHMQQPTMHLNHPLLPDQSANERQNSSKLPVSYAVQPGNSDLDSKRSVAPNGALAVKNFFLKWGKSSNKKQRKKNYYLVIDLDSTKIARFIQKHAGKRDTNWQNLPQNKFWCQKFLQADSFLVPVNIGGHFYWTVFEYKNDRKLRCIRKKTLQIANYTLSGANLEIKAFAFEYSPLLTRDDYHGELKVEVKNSGNQPAENAWLTLRDSVLTPFKIDEAMNSRESNAMKILARKQIPLIKAGETRLVTFPWRTSFIGKHKIEIQASDRSEQVVYSQQSQIFLTIPKGTVTTDENPVALKIIQVSIEIPIITEISFDANSCVVRPEYLHKEFFAPSLLVLANRLKQHPEAIILLRGYSDVNSDIWNAKLADNRALAIRDSLVNLGVKPEQINIQRGHILPRIDYQTTSEESQWILEERRHVQIVIKPADQPKLLNPIQYIDFEVTPLPVRFESPIKTSIPLKKGFLQLNCHKLKDEIDFSDQISSQKIPLWTPIKVLADTGWLENEISYFSTITDSLGRIFKTKNQVIHLKKLILNKEHRMVLPLKFAQSHLRFESYWARIFDQITNLFADPEKKLCFTGHACAIGSEVSNYQLSQKRAERFHAGLLEFIRKKHPEYYGLIKERMIPARGFGESRPLMISRLNGEQILIGDNFHALGRRLNRRIEVIFSQEEKLSNF